MAETTAPRSWSDIPLELGGLVLHRLPAHVDRVRFAAVCPQWCVAARDVPLPPPLPLLALPDGTVYSLPGNEPLRFPACTGYADACGNWLAFSGEDGCFLRNPFSKETLALPGLFRVQARGRRMGEQPVKWKEMEDAPEQLTIYKLLYCSPQLIATFVRRKESIRVAVCRPGSSWWSVHMDHQFPLFHQGNLYVLDHLKDVLFVIVICVDHTTGDPWVSSVRRAINTMPLPRYFLNGDLIFVTKVLYLVELRGALLMVHRKMHGKWMKLPIQAGTCSVVPTGVNEFEVFKADIERMQWTRVTTIGDDQVLFLWRRCSRFVSVAQNEMPGDCIVFLENDDEDHDWCDKENSDTCCVYDIKNGSVSTGPPMCSWKRGLVPATWLFPEA